MAAMGKLLAHNKVALAMDLFDFKKCQRIMRFLGWVWHGSKGTPTIPELKEVAKDLLETVCADTSDHALSSTGGLTAMRFHDSIELRFVPVESGA